MLRYWDACGTQVLATALSASSAAPVTVTFVTHEAHRGLLTGPFQRANVKLRTLRHAERVTDLPTVSLPLVQLFGETDDCHCTATQLASGRQLDRC